MSSAIAVVAAVTVVTAIVAAAADAVVIAVVVAVVADFIVLSWLLGALGDHFESPLGVILVAFWHRRGTPGAPKGTPGD